MDVKRKVVESQKKIIGALAQCETRIGSLYEKYASCFPAMKTMWLSLAAAEKTHADMLRTMNRILDKGNIFYNLGKFSDEAIQPIVTLVDDALKKTGHSGLTFSEAISTALRIETSIVDSHFYDVVASDAPEFRIIAERLSADTKTHVDTIRNHFQKDVQNQTQGSL